MSSHFTIQEIHPDCAALIERRAISKGAALARAVFQKRGNHSEAHMTETELAALLAFAFQHGAEWATYDE